MEYKRGVDAGVINQGLFYLSRLVDHRAEFEHLVATGSGHGRGPGAVEQPEAEL